jgi:hypothetical protein
MGDPDTTPAESPTDRLSAVREWLWRHSSQPNGDPWDSDPEHLDRAAQNLLNELLRWFISTDVSTGTTGQDTGCARDRRDVPLLASALSSSLAHRAAPWPAPPHPRRSRARRPGSKGVMLIRFPPLASAAFLKAGR